MTAALFLLGTLVNLEPLWHLSHPSRGATTQPGSHTGKRMCTVRITVPTRSSGNPGQDRKEDMESGVTIGPGADQLHP